MTWALLKAARMSYRLMADVAVPTLGAATLAMAAGASRLGRSALAGRHGSTSPEASGGAQSSAAEASVEAEDAPASCPRGVDAAGDLPADSAARGCRHAQGPSGPVEDLEAAPSAGKDVLAPDAASSPAAGAGGPEAPCAGGGEAAEELPLELEPAPPVEREVLHESQAEVQLAAEVRGPSPCASSSAEALAGQPGASAAASPRVLARLAVLGVWHLQRSRPP